MGGVAMTQDVVISQPTLSRLGGDRSQCSDWLLIALQWAELAAPPMSVLGHTILLAGRLYIRTVFDWCGLLVTGSLLFVAPVRHQATASSGGVVLGSPQVSAGVLLWAEDCGFRAVSVAQPVSEIQSRDVSILLCTQRVGMTLLLLELYDLDPDCVLDVLGLHAQRPEAPLIKVM